MPITEFLGLLNDLPCLFWIQMKIMHPLHNTSIN
jgi:hypothetical protein